MAYQFARLQTFSRKGTSTNRSVSDILKEAERRAAHCPHVENPGQPIIVEGLTPSDLMTEIEQRCDGGRGKRIRKDRHVLEAGVASYPTKVCDLDTDETNRLDRWIEDATEHMRKDMADRGVQLVSVVQHMDEEHPHLHFYGLPIAADLNAKKTHPGHAAQDQAKKSQEKNPSTAYRHAMRDWQDRFHEAVSEHHGHARLGPKRRRMDRTSWTLEKEENRRRREAYERIERMEIEAEAKMKEAEARDVKIDEAWQEIRTARTALQQQEVQFRQDVERTRSDIKKEKVQLAGGQQILKQNEQRLAADQKSFETEKTAWKAGADAIAKRQILDVDRNLNMAFSRLTQPEQQQKIRHDIAPAGNRFLSWASGLFETMSRTLQKEWDRQVKRLKEFETKLLVREKEINRKIEEAQPYLDRADQEKLREIGRDRGPDMSF